MKKFLLITSLLFFPILHAEDKYASAVFELLEVTGANESQKVMLNQMFSQFKGMYPDNPEFSNIEELMIKELNILNSKLVPIYKKHLTLEEINELIKIYETPILKKLVQKQPLIVQESVVVGMEWGQELAKRLTENK